MMAPRYHRGLKLQFFQDPEHMPALRGCHPHHVKPRITDFRRKPICFRFDATNSARQVVTDILASARERARGGPVAQHLVGAKLAIRFPHLTIGNRPYGPPYDASGSSGDFHIGNTVFHVTIDPGLGHMVRCENNLQEGLHVFLIVPHAKIEVARALLETQGLKGRIALESLQSFVGQTLLELAEFTRDNFVKTVRDLLREYNRRVADVETDGSLFIQIPTALRSQGN